MHQREQFNAIISMFQQLIIIHSKRKEMLNISTATYIKKLVKIIYEKEKQIELLKKGSKNTSSKPDEDMIDREIRDELSYTSTQLKQVNQQISTMERSMAQLEADFDEEIIKNIQNQQRISTLTSQNTELKTTIKVLQDQLEDLQNKNNQLAHNIEDRKQREQKTLNQKMELLVKLRKMDDLTNQIKKQSQQKTDRLEREITNYENKLNTKIAQLKTKQEEIELLKKEIQNKHTTGDEALRQIQQQEYYIKKQEEQIIELNHILHAKDQQLVNKDNEIQKIQCNLLIKQSQTKLNYQAFTNYKEFYYQINQYIESAYLRYCSQAFLQTSRRHRQTDHQQNRFQSTLKKMTALQTWMEDASSKIQKSKIPEVGIQTIQNLSIIVHSFENKLQNCDLTQKLQRDREDMLKNQQLLLDNLQKDCQSSYQHDRIKAVQLDQMKQILKMTKDVNRELMDEINKKECVISECRKMYETVLGNKAGQEYKAIKQMLNIKSR